MAVRVLAERRPLDNIEQLNNNALAMALNSKSSKCVQMVLDATTSHKVRVCVCAHMWCKHMVCLWL